MLHITELKGASNQQYGKMEMFERFSYETFNRRILDYAFKATMPAQRDFKKTSLGKALYGALRFYEAVTLRKSDEEISSLDYFTLRMLRDLAYQIKMQNLAGALGVFSNTSEYVKKMNEWRDEKDSGMVFEISKEIERIGLIKYLRLDEDRIVDELNRKYAGKRQGIDLLIELLKKRHEGAYP
jgi:hypothetical protein